MSFGISPDIFGNFLASIWWLLLPFILLPLIASLMTFVKHETAKRSAKWTLLDVRISREIKKTPEAMEQILSTIHGWGGKSTDWNSLEIVSLGGEVHFFARVPEKNKEIVKATFFSFYQNVDIHEEPDDYAERIPSNNEELYSRGLDAWGGELILDKEGIFPIRSYKEFGTGSSDKPGDGKDFDPLSVLVEILGRVQKDEILGLQIILMPVKTKDVKAKYKAALDKLKGEAPKPGESPKPKTAGEMKAAKAVEENFMKPIFNAIIRVIYVAPKTIFQDNYAKQGILTAFNQYSAPDLNSFKLNENVAPGVKPDKFPYVFAKERNEHRKAHLLHKYRHRDIPHWSDWGKVLTSSIFHRDDKTKFVELSTESLATIYHLPTNAVMTAPYMKRIESRKVGAPSGLAIFGGEEDMEIFGL